MFPVPRSCRRFHELSQDALGAVEGRCWEDAVMPTTVKTTINTKMHTTRLTCSMLLPKTADISTPIPFSKASPTERHLSMNSITLSAILLTVMKFSGAKPA